MSIYQPPVRDMRFLFEEALHDPKLRELPAYAELDGDTLETILEEAGKFCVEQLLPLNRDGDESGCRFEDGEVTTAPGFREAYRAYTEAGWNALAMDADYGGQGLPKMLHLMVDEMLNSSNMAFSLFPGLTNGAYAALHAYASEELKQAYFPKMADGTWSATMCLTEPHCGTDLGLLRSRAEPLADGSYRISGTKIFITAGEHDLTDNILHLVLARTPDAPKGVKGISLFLVPKHILGSNGQVREDNGVFCGSIEHKMGIKASPTCVMNFDGAVGYLVGELNKGMRAMFKMMNSERVAVGVQGLGIGEVAYQNAVLYARERLQGRALTGAKNQDAPADPLLVHADVRRMLLTARATIEGGRALAVWLGMLLDRVEHESDTERRQQADDLVALLTPVCKALLTDFGFEAAVLGQQVFGGHGYIREHGMEQLVRDARIAQIYEGTNGVQAMDLVGRKLPAEGGRYFNTLLAEMNAVIDAYGDKPALAEFVAPTAAARDRLITASRWLAEQAPQNPDHAGAAANDYLRLMGLAVLAMLWLRMAAAAQARGDDFAATKLKTARYFFTRVLPQTAGLLDTLTAGADSLMAFEDEEF